MPGQKEMKHKRQANVYDAVAGRVATTSGLAPDPSAARKKATDDGVYRLKDATLAPEEVLFQRRGAPMRYAEHDVYFAPLEALPDSGGRGVLPDGDLLKAVHAHAADLYERLGEDCFVGARHVDERSMDETALIAFGILVEEAGRELLGRRGDLVFTEGLADEHEDDGVESGTGGARSRSEGVREREMSVGVMGDGEHFWRRSYPKRRKTADGSRGTE